MWHTYAGWRHRPAQLLKPQFRRAKREMRALCWPIAATTIEVIFVLGRCVCVCFTCGRHTFSTYILQTIRNVYNFDSGPYSLFYNRNTANNKNMKRKKNRWTLEHPLCVRSSEKMCTTRKTKHNILNGWCNGRRRKWGRRGNNNKKIM